MVILKDWIKRLSDVPQYRWRKSSGYTESRFSCEKQTFNDVSENLLTFRFQLCIFINQFHGTLLKEEEHVCWIHGAFPSLSEPNHPFWACWSWCASVFLLDHEGDVLIQVARVKLDQVHEDMQEIWGQTDFHPQQDKPSWKKIIQVWENVRVSKWVLGPVYSWY